jgi:hypothetical protein
MMERLCCPEGPLLPPSSTIPKKVFEYLFSERRTHAKAFEVDCLHPDAASELWQESRRKTTLNEHHVRSWPGPRPR